MGVDGERHTELSDLEVESLSRCHLGVCVEHLYLSLVREVYLSLVAHGVDHLSRDAYSRVSHFKASFSIFCLVFIFSAYSAVNLRRKHLCLSLVVVLCHGTCRCYHGYCRSGQNTFSFYHIS